MKAGLHNKKNKKQKNEEKAQKTCGTGAMVRLGLPRGSPGVSKRCGKREGEGHKAPTPPDTFGVLSRFSSHPSVCGAVSTPFPQVTVIYKSIKHRKLEGYHPLKGGAEG